MYFIPEYCNDVTLEILEREGKFDIVIKLMIPLILGVKVLRTCIPYFGYIHYGTMIRMYIIKCSSKENYDFPNF